MNERHLSPEALEQWLAGEETEADRCASLLHRLEVCPQCSEVGGYILDLHRAGHLPAVFGRLDVELAQSRAEAPTLWEELSGLSLNEQLVRIDHEPRFRSLGLCELLAQKSEAIAASEVVLAVEIAELAVAVADRLEAGKPFEEDWLDEVRSLAWIYLANARRVLGELRSAEEADAVSDRFWADREEDALGYRPVLWDLQASLRIAQRRFPEALGLLDRVIHIYKEGRPEQRDPHLAGRAMVKKAFAFADAEQPEAAVELLKEAVHLIDPGRDPRLLLCCRHNLVWNLTTLGRFEEARELLPGVQGLCRELENALDLARLRWTEGRVAAGTGERREAVRMLDEVWRAFLDRGMAYDASLAALELAALYDEEGQTAEVKDLVRGMVPIFLSQEVHREALAALAVFQNAALTEAANAGLARQVAAFLLRARHDPDARFPGVAEDAEPLLFSGSGTP